MAVIIGSPVDVVKIRVMNSPTKIGVLSCFANTFKNEGFFAFYNGFNANV